MHSRVILITGGNSGVGLALAKRFLDPSTNNLSREVLGSPTLVLACRNMDKAKKAKSELLELNAKADVQLLKLDTGSVSSVLSAADEVLKRFERLDLLYCNAGAMPIDSLCVPAIFKGLFTHPIEFLSSSEALNQKRGLLTKDGLGETFQTNVFGHYLFIHKLIPLMEATGNARVIWTGSSASHLQFSLSDYQHIHGPNPYESSKYMVDQIAIPLDKKLSKHGIHCYVAEPGNVCSNFLTALNQPVLQAFIVMAFYIFRILLRMERFTITAENGCYSNYYLGMVSDSNEDGIKLDPRFKYHSEVTYNGKPYVTGYPLVYYKGTGNAIIEKLDKLVDKFDKSSLCSFYPISQLGAPNL